MEKITVISLGGSLIVPNGGIDAVFLRRFRKLILSHLRRGRQFIIICGGGKIARHYQQAVRAVGGKLTADDVDWLGIHATRLNAHLLRTIFRRVAHPTVVKNPTRPPRWSESVLIAAGWKPGASTDYDAVLLARRFNAKTVVNLSNVSYVYDKDPAKYRGARKLPEVSWKDFRKIVGNRWDPGANLPFDPVASRLAEKIGLRVLMVKGSDFKSVDAALRGKKFRGTVIQ